jgi:hypothetical protein
MALVTAEIGLRLYQRDPPQAAIKQIRQMGVSPLSLSPNAP